MLTVRVKLMNPDTNKTMTVISEGNTKEEAIEVAKEQANSVWGFKGK